MTHPNTLSRVRGSIIAGAIGDALGNPVEFISHRSILTTYGSQGITQFDTHPRWTDASGKAVFTDDTQMTLFTAEGLLNADRTHSDAITAITEAYLEWFGTQTGHKSEEHHHGTLRDLDALNVRRAPGNTCLTALASLWCGKQPHNDSKGCGGVMRIAPIPLFAATHHMSIEEADKMSADAAKVTHLHPLGYIPAALMSHVIYRAVAEAQPTRERLIEWIKEGCDTLPQLFVSHAHDVAIMQRLALQAIELAENDRPDIDNIAQLGEGWVGEEALAIALYCAVRHFDNLEQALIAAVNHNGDSDSTGAVTGNILGAAVGCEAIPQHFIDGIEQLDLLLSVADALGGERGKGLRHSRSMRH